jgi:hypothetical protein
VIPDEVPIRIRSPRSRHAALTETVSAAATIQAPKKPTKWQSYLSRPCDQCRGEQVEADCGRVAQI